MSSSTEDSTPQILLPKIVSFETNGSELALMEQNIYSIYNEIPSAKLLQAFPVEKEDAETITFKWAYGLASIPVKSFSVSGARPETGNVQTEGSEVAYPATASYLRSAKIKENRLELRQVMRIRSLEGKLVQENLSVS